MTKMIFCQTSQDSIKISTIQRDSIVSKLIHRKALIGKAGNLEMALEKCDSVKAIFYKKIVTYKNNELILNNSLRLKDNQIKDLRTALKLSEKQTLNEKKIGRRKSFWKFVWGLFVGGLGVFLIK